MSQDMSTPNGEAAVKVENLRKLFPVSKGMFRKATDFIHAIDDVSFEIKPGESLGLGGESGCGKTTTGRILVKLDEASGGSGGVRDQVSGELDVVAGEVLRRRRNGDQADQQQRGQCRK